MIPHWKEYQEEAAAFFRSLGLEAQADQTVRGVRTSHDVDVLVRASFAGFELVWIVECKRWRSRVSKLHVMALREIVADVGADKGLLLSQAGFQSGAVEAATSSNVFVTSLAELKSSAGPELDAWRLRDLHARIEACYHRYWEIPKDVRIEAGLRPDVGIVGYSSVQVIELVRDLLRQAHLGTYPLRSNMPATILLPEYRRWFETPAELQRSADSLVRELEAKLVVGEALLAKGT